MIVTTYHTHSDLCDGKGKLEEYVESAARKGFAAFGFSGHSPLPVPDDWTLQTEDIPGYIESGRELKRQAASAMGPRQAGSPAVGSLAGSVAGPVEGDPPLELYVGMEVDYLEEGPKAPGNPSDGPALAPDLPNILELDLDYIIGSVHTVARFPDGSYPGVDGPKDMYQRIFEELFDSDMQALVREYYRLVRRMITDHRFDILGHIDLVKLRNPKEEYYRESDRWYRREVLTTLDALEANGAIMEINTGGLARGKCHDMYPSEWIVAEARKRDIPLQINSDAHHPEGIDSYYGAAAERARRAGYTVQRVLLGGERRDVPLDIPADLGMPVPGSSGR
jgi:histidinol-phosphatase (PHP family)